MHLLLVIVLGVITTILLLGGLCLLSPDTTWSSTTKWRAQCEVDVLLGVETDDERRNVDDLLTNTDVSLTDENTGVVDRLGQTELVDTGLQTTLQEILNLQGQHVIELHAGFVENTNADETADEGVSFEKSLGVLLVESEQFTIHVSCLSRFHVSKSACIPGSTANLRESELDTPDLTLVAETILADELQFEVPGSRISDLNRDKLMHIGLVGILTIVPTTIEKVLVNGLAQISISEKWLTYLERTTRDFVLYCCQF